MDRRASTRSNRCYFPQGAIVRTLIVGLGKSGKAAKNLLEKEGDEVTGFDDLTDSTVPNVKSFDRLILSPGVSPSHRVVSEAVLCGIPIIGEAQLALERMNQRAIAITGTNGKTTVTLLIAHILKEAGFSAHALGNVGAPLSDYVLVAKPDDIAVVELSSYQLDTLSAKCFDTGLILNITPDHLDRYPSMEAYAQSKCHLQDCLKPGGQLWVHSSVAHEFAHLLSDKFHLFGENLDCLLTQHCINFSFSGKHDIDNLQAAWIATRPYVTEDLFWKAVQSFKKPAHRIEWVATWNGVDYVNDSKGTNIDATIKAVEAMDRSTILIVGGVDKGASYAVWKKSFANKVRQVVAIGEASQKIAHDLRPEFDVVIMPSLSDAVDLSQRIAQKGDVVLLSPGCSSFDMFRDYAHRGDEFKRIVYLLQEKKG